MRMFCARPGCDYYFEDNPSASAHISPCPKCGSYTFVSTKKPTDGPRNAVSEAMSSAALNVIETQKQNRIAEIEKPEEQWPAVDAAYSFVLPSYQLLVGRFEAADTRLTSLLTLSSTLTLAAPLFAKSVQPTISFRSPFFVFAMAVFLLAAIVGILGRVAGTLALPDPMIMYEKSLHCSEWEFKKNQIYFAGEHFDYNVQAVRKKGNVAICVTIMLLLEIVAFVIWIIK